MTLLLFKYILPTLLGYTLFVGIAGRYNPVKKPALLEERPSWLLGLWTGLCVILVLGIGLHMAYGMPLEAARGLAKPVALSLAGLLGMGILTYFAYFHHIQSKLESLQTEEKSDQIDWISKVQQLDPLLEVADKEQNAAILNAQSSSASNETIIELTDQQLRRLEGETTSQVETQTTGNKLEDLEATVSQLRQELIASRHEVRKHVAARAKALSTANKSIAFARQTIELRAQLENELSSVRETLVVRQNTIARLIQRLETEQKLSEDELAVLKGYAAMNDESSDSLNRMKDGTTNS